MFEPLEARSLLSTYLYEDQPDLFELPVVDTALSTIPDAVGGSMVRLGDVDGDGVDDFAAGHDGFFQITPFDIRRDPGTVSIISGKGTLIRTIRNGEHGFGAVVCALADRSDDGVRDLMVYQPPGDLALGQFAKWYVYSGADGQRLSTLGMTAAYARTRLASMVEIEDITGDGRRELVLRFGGSSISSGAVICVTGQALDVLWDRRAGADRAVAVGDDLNGDGRSELYLVRYLWRTIQTPDGNQFRETYASQMNLINGATGAWITSSEPEDPQIGDPVVISDVDGDGVRDVAVNLGGRLTIRSGRTLTVLATGRAESSQAPLSEIGDLNGDGYVDLALSFGAFTPFVAGVRFDALSGRDLSIISRVTTTRTDIQAPFGLFRAGDVDADGFTDFLFGAGPTSGTGALSFPSAHILPGAALAAPVVVGFNDQLDAWGTIGHDAFITINQKAVLTTSLDGFQDGDRVTSVFKRVILGISGGPDHEPFARIDTGVRLMLRDADFGTGITGPIRALPQRGDDTKVLVERIIDGLPSAWLIDLSRKNAQRLFDGTPVGLSDRGDLIFGVAPNGTDTVFGTLSGGFTSTIPGFVATGITYGTQLIGVRQTDDGPTGAIYNTAGHWRDIPAFRGSVFRPIAGGAMDVPNEQIILGQYTDSLTGINAWALYSLPIGKFEALAEIDAKNAPDGVLSDADLRPIHMTNPGVLLGVLRGSAFALRSLADAQGPYEADAGSSVDLAREGTLAVAVNAAGQLRGWFRTLIPQPQDLPHVRYLVGWTRMSFAVLAGAEFTGSAVIWTDPSGTTAYAAAGTTRGLVVSVGTLSGGFDHYFSYSYFAWSSWQFISEEVGHAPIVKNLNKLAYSPTQMILTGIDTNGDLVMFGQTGRRDSSGREIWAYDNLTTSVLEPNSPPGKAPIFNTEADGDLVTYTTPWGGLNIAGSAGGVPYAVWWAPGRQGWAVTNLAAAVDPGSGSVPYVAFPAVNITPWGGISLSFGLTKDTNHPYGGTLQRDTQRLTTLWWAPGQGGLWKQADLALLAEGQPPGSANERITAYTHPWGGQNIVRSNSDGTVWVYWWTPVSGGWKVERLDTKVAQPHAGYTGRITALVVGSGATHLMTPDSTGHVIEFTWAPTDNRWTVADLSRA